MKKIVIYVVVIGLVVGVAVEVFDLRSKVFMGLMEYGADNGSPMAKGVLEALEDPEVIAQSYSAEKYKKLLENAAEGTAEEQGEAGLIAYCRGDYDNAVVWLTEAAEKGNVEAQTVLGEIYFGGEKVGQDYEKAAKWLRRAAENNYSLSQTLLGVMYENGLGVEQNYQEAEMWYEKAANQGESTAQNNLGYMYENGIGIEQNHELALIYYRKSADQGNLMALINLGTMYYEGNAIEQDYQKAIEYYSLAA